MKYVEFMGLWVSEDDDDIVTGKPQNEKCKLIIDLDQIEHIYEATVPNYTTIGTRSGNTFTVEYPYHLMKKKLLERMQEIITDGNLQRQN